MYLGISKDKLYKCQHVFVDVSTFCAWIVHHWPPTFGWRYQPVARHVKPMAPLRPARSPKKGKATWPHHNGWSSSQLIVQSVGNDKNANHEIEKKQWKHTSTGYFRGKPEILYNHLWLTIDSLVSGKTKARRWRWHWPPMAPANTGILRAERHQLRRWPVRLDSDELRWLITRLYIWPSITYESFFWR